MDRAITIDTRLIREANRKDLESALALDLARRGIVIRLLRGRVVDCLKDHHDAIAIYRRLVEKEGHHELARDFAGALNNRGLALLALKRYPVSVQDFGAALAIFTDLGKRDHGSWLDNKLALTLCWRGQSYLNSDQPAECIQDLTRAEALLTPFKQQGLKGAANNLAGCLNDRAIAFGQLANLEAAIKDFSRVVEIRREQVNMEKGEETSARLAAALLNRAIALEKDRKGNDALADVEEAMGTYSVLVEAGRSQYEKPLNSARRFRADLKRAANRWKNEEGNIAAAPNPGVPKGTAVAARSSSPGFFPLSFTSLSRFRLALARPVSVQNRSRYVLQVAFPQA